MEVCASSKLRAEAFALAVEGLQRPLIFIDDTGDRVDGNQFNAHRLRGPHADFDQVNRFLPRVDEEGEHVSHIVSGPHEVSTPAAVQREVACGIAVEQGSIADVNVPLRIASASKVGRGGKGQV